MAKIQLKSDNITPFGVLYLIINRFDRSGVRKTIDSFLGRRSSDPKAFSYGECIVYVICALNECDILWICALIE